MQVPLDKLASVSPVPNSSATPVSVVLRVWIGPDRYADETHEFVSSGDSLWYPVKYERMCCGYIDLINRFNPNLLIVLNGTLLQATSPAELMNRVRGQVVDGIVVFGANDSSYTSKLGSRAAAGGIIIGTHPPRRRP